MAWGTTSGRTAPLPPDWARRRAAAITAAGGTCTTTGCGEPATDVDHVTPAHLGGTDHPGNLVALCGPCHRTKTTAEAIAQQARYRAAARRTITHPLDR